MIKKVCPNCKQEMGVKRTNNRLDGLICENCHYKWGATLHSEIKPATSSRSACSGGLSLLVEIYNMGYHSGHDDTVEGCYIDVLPVDMTTYHEELVKIFVSYIKKR